MAGLLAFFTTLNPKVDNPARAAGIREKCTSTDFSAPARPLSRVIGGAEAGVLLSIIIMMIFMLNIGKARQLLNQQVTYD